MFETTADIFKVMQYKSMLAPPKVKTVCHTAAHNYAAVSRRIASCNNTHPSRLCVYVGIP